MYSLKNQYVGDIGDYTKLSLLRAINGEGLSVGINWYLTPDDRNGDGRFTGYLNECDRLPDPVLARKLRYLVVSGTRTICQLETMKLLPNASYYHEMLDFSTCTDRMRHRVEWHKTALSLLQTQDAVFLDPDNGLEIKSVGSFCKNGNKYVTYQEAADYYKAGLSVIIYQHRDRSPEPQYLGKLMRFRERKETVNAELICLKAGRKAVRDYLIISRPEHAAAFYQTMDILLRPGWDAFFCRRML